MILMIVILFAFMYFGMMRPQKKQQQKRTAMLDSMKKGDKVVTIGGLHAVIDSLDKEAGTVDLDVDGVYLTFNLSAIRTVGDQPRPAAVAATKPAAKATPAKVAAPAEEDTKPAADEKPANDAATSDSDDSASDKTDADK